MGCIRSGFNFINIVQAAFMRADPESIKKTNSLTVFFVLLGSASAKAAHRMLIKLTIGYSFIGILQTPFSELAVSVLYYLPIGNWRKSC